MAYGLSYRLPAEDTHAGKARSGLQTAGVSTNLVELIASQHLLIQFAVTNPNTFLLPFLKIQSPVPKVENATPAMLEPAPEATTPGQQCTAFSDLLGMD